MNNKTQICPICNRSDKVFELCSVNNFNVYACSFCGAEHVYPVPDASILKAYYDREQWFEGGEAGGYENYDKQTAWSVEIIGDLLSKVEGSGLSILDIGCGYGTHLKVAADLNWKCFGVELSDHARAIAHERLGNRAYIVESVGELIPHEFDVILMLDVIEHLEEPYSLLYSLFSIGAITPKTRIFITTPNAGSSQAQANPESWPYRHPPSHLTYYKAETFEFLLKKLQFKNIEVNGMHPLNDGLTEPLKLIDFGGLFIKASGSNFTEFMRERYVPGTWSKIAEYEHLPRYELVKNFVIGKKALDFGCGTGYGSATLAEVAEKVIGLDIDSSAIDWANGTHKNPNLDFLLCDDLGATLPAKSFDLITCFEMIEHVNYETQLAAISSIARLLKNDGIFIISTPNPIVTALYGDNPYHLREMTEVQFRELLASEFPYVEICYQRVQNSISFEFDKNYSEKYGSVNRNKTEISPLAYIAFCSRQPLPVINPFLVFDEKTDVIHQFMSQQNKNFQIRYQSYTQAEEIFNQSCKQAEEISKLKSDNDQIAKDFEQRANLLNKDLSAAVNEINNFKYEVSQLESTIKEMMMQRERELSSWKFLMKKLIISFFGFIK